MHLRNITAHSWPAGTAPLSLRSSNAFQMAAQSSVEGFRPEACAYRLVLQVHGRALPVLPAGAGTAVLPCAAHPLARSPCPAPPLAATNLHMAGHGR